MDNCRYILQVSGGPFWLFIHSSFKCLLIIYILLGGIKLNGSEAPCSRSDLAQHDLPV